MKKRMFFVGMDECYEDYLLTKCPVYPNIFIGSLECIKCSRFLKLHEKYDEINDKSIPDDKKDLTDYVICKR